MNPIMSSNKTKQEAKVTSVRLGQGFAKDSYLIGSTPSGNVTPFKESEELVRNMIYFFTELAQKGPDIFGYISFDASQFSGEFGYNRSNLQRGIDENQSKMTLPIIDSSGEHQITNNFEKLLLDIATHNIPQYEKDENDNWEIVFVPVIEKLKIQVPENNSGEYQSRKYFVKLSEMFNQNMISFFSTTYSPLYKALKTNHKRTKGLQELYLKLEHIRTLLHKNSDNKKVKYLKTPSISISAFVKHAQLEGYESREQKRKMTQKLNVIRSEAAKFPDIGFDFEFEWVKGPNAKYEYDLVFTFEFTEGYYEKKQAEDDRTWQLFERHYRQLLAYEYQTTDKNYVLEEWLENDKIDKALKRNIYAKVYKQIFRKEPSQSLLNTRFR